MKANKHITLVHCSYHKCLTVYYAKIMRTLYDRILRFSRGYKHFNSMVEDFYSQHRMHKISSVNNHCLDPDRLGDVRISRFIRDPRDLIVSGYFYHKRGAEDWCNIVAPKDKDWQIVNGNIPRNMGGKHSFSTFLQSLNQEDGLIAEMEFRKNHFGSMRKWPHDNPRIKTFRYEDIIGNEEDVFRQIFEFYELPWLDRILGVHLARKFKAGKQRKAEEKHIRDPKPDQWKYYFTPKVNDAFNQEYGDLLKILGYE